MSNEVHRTAKPHERPSSIYDAMTSYLPAVGRLVESYLPQAVRGFGRKAGPIPRPADSLEPLHREPIKWVNFQYSDFLGSRRLYLIVGYERGFQIWDSNSVYEMQEIASRRDYPTSQITLLPAPAEEVLSVSDARPLMAIVVVDQPTQLKLYSLRTHEIAHSIDVGVLILSVRASSRVISVCTQDKVLLYDLITFDLLVTYPCGGLAEERGALAIGSRWIAYSSNEPAPRNSADVSAEWTVENARQMASDVAGQIGAGLSFIGDIGKRHLSAYLYGDAAPPLPQPAVESQPAAVQGVVMIRDLVSKELVTHFRAHVNRIVCMEFDFSGTLLATADSCGREFHVYKMFPDHVRCVYRLTRGMIDANIVGLAFSDDSRWLSATSDHGTVHVFAINSYGGPVDLVQMATSNKTHPYAVEGPAVSMNAVARIRQHVEQDRASIQACSFLRSDGICPYVVLVGPSGALAIDKLVVTQQRGTSDEQPHAQVTTTRTREWNVQREDTWETLDQPLLPTDATRRLLDPTDDLPEQSKWVQQAELHTHEPVTMPLWRRNQFTIRGSDDQSPPERGRLDPLPLSKDGSPLIPSDLPLAATELPPAQLREALNVAMKTPLEGSGTFSSS
eukprot:TRINITY_DN14429_c0_g1_i1.p1 TRINITY_DN14429_c0_g1~~TRINITY_DN14429_c0_g1_i1.p1  ORF type:complete len:618 (+),score=121.18 TRINITY_DN14429_c0_g1_i1:145-1998(+)